MMIAESQRLEICEFTTDNVNDLFGVCSDAEIMKYVGDSTPLTFEQTQKWIEVSMNNYATHGYGNFAVFYKPTHEFIGYCGLVKSAHLNDIELIYAFKKMFWGKGIATEACAAIIGFAFSKTGLQQIYASIDPENLASKKILEKTGFTYLYDRADEHGLNTSYFKISRGSNFTPAPPRAPKTSNSSLI